MAQEGGNFGTQKSHDIVPNAKSIIFYNVNVVKIQSLKLVNSSKPSFKRILVKRWEGLYRLANV